ANNPLPLGTVVHERYRINAVVGRGGLGTVYQVTDVLFGKQNVYALKELIDQSPGARKQFELESQWLQSLDHNHIPKVREHFEWQGRLYLVMDFVDGENLEQKLVRVGVRGLGEAQLIGWVVPICDALHYLHTRLPPILHRDVKPANIIVTPAGHPVLVDLGIAKEHLPGANQTLTFVRKAGTEGYAPPEQYAAGGQTGPWSDVYGLGATLYHLVTGRVPPTAVERVALDRKLVHPRDLNPAVSPQLDAIIYRALALRPAERFPSMVEFAQALSPGSGAKIAAHAQAPNSPAIPRTPPAAASWPSRPSSHPSAPSLAATPIGSSPSPVPPSPATPISPISPISHASLPSGRLMGAERAGGTGRFTAATHATRIANDAAAPARDGKDDRVDDGDAPHQRMSRRRVVVFAGIACVLAIFIGLGAVLIAASAPPDRSTPEATVSGYYSALKAQDYARAWQYDADSRNNSSSQSQFMSDRRSEDQQYGRVTAFTVMPAQSESATQAAVQVNVTRAGPGGPTTTTFTVALTQYNGGTWLINSITAT
ncbi:MAG TPA: protein kinase, partial [Ktedonobacterales bacterium]|nr:protein kinase [Ktedonobacterales bacterium]